MKKGLEIDAKIGLCTKEMAKENPIKDFEILIEEHKDKWSTQMYDYFKECLNEIKNKLKALDIIKKHIDLEDYDTAVCILERKLTQEEYDLLKGVLL